MAGNGTLRNPMEGLKDFCSAEIWSMGMSKVNEPPRRFEAGFFASEGYVAVDAMHHSGFVVTTVGDHSRVKWFGPFARKYVTDKGHGCPFLTSSTMMEARPRAEKLVSVKHTHHLEALKVYEDDILISCSGTIGNVVLCTKDVNGWACSQDAIRVTAQEPNSLGPVYCFLQSPLGQFLLKKSQTGSVIRHIYEADVSTLPIPCLPRALREELTRLVKQASALRVEANRLLDKADEMVQKQLYLPDIAEFDDHLASDPLSIHAFSTSSKSFYERAWGRGSVRLDATFYTLAVRRLRKIIFEAKHSTTLGQVTKRIYRTAPGKRTYVDDPAYGLPLIGGKHLSQLRLREVNYLSKANTVRNAMQTVAAGTTLISTGGTIGRCEYTHRNYEHCVASEDVMRLCPDEAKVAPGFLYAFMASQYGQLQLHQLIFGSVILRLRHFQLPHIAIRLPDDNGWRIHEVVLDAYNKKAEAMDAEVHAFNLFMTAVKQGRKMIESEWGDQY